MRINFKENIRLKDTPFIFGIKLTTTFLSKKNDYQYIFLEKENILKPNN